MELSGQMVPESLDGLSLVPLLKNAGTLSPWTLFWKLPLPYKPDRWAVRSADYKVVAENSIDTAESVTRIDGLYKVSEDLHEDRDLSASSPERLKDLTAAWNRWNESLPKEKPTVLSGGIMSFDPNNCTIRGTDANGAGLLFSSYLFDADNGTYARFNKLKGATVRLAFKEPVAMGSLVLSTGGWPNWSMAKKVHITVNGKDELAFELKDKFVIGGREDLRALQQVAIDQEVRTLEIRVDETTYATPSGGHHIGGFGFIGMTEQER